MSQPTVVLVHGFGESATIWSHLATELRSHYRVLVPDFSTAAQFSTIDEYAVQLHAQLVGAEVQRCVVIGHSMGGYIALAFAEKYPQMLDGLGLFHSTAYADTDERKELRLKNVAFIEKHGTEAFVRNFTPNLYAEAFVVQHPAALTAHIEGALGLPSAALVAGMKAMRLRPDRTHVLREASCPVLFIVGRLDKSVSPEHALEQAQLPSRVHTLVLDHVGHMGMVEAPEACTSAVKAFLAECYLTQ